MLREFIWIEGLIQGCGRGRSKLNGDSNEILQ